MSTLLMILLLIITTSSHAQESKEELCVSEPACNTLSIALVYEARGEGREGMEWVANVIVERSKRDNRWPDTIEGVIYQHRQFSFLMDLHEQKPPLPKDWMLARQVAYDAIHSTENRGGVDHFHTVDISPVWAKKLRKIKVVGRHVFYTSLK